MNLDQRELTRIPRYFRDVEPEVIEDPFTADLCAAVETCANDRALLLRFLRDLLTVAEIRTFAKRWAAARLLLEGESQMQTARRIGMSNRPVNQIDQWIHGAYATGGYWAVHEKLKLAKGGDEN